MDASGAPTAFISGGPLAVPGALPGETVEVVVEGGPQRPRVRLLDVVKPSAGRVVPRCRHAAECGGCSWQHIAYTEQLRLKRQIVRRLLRARMGEAAPTVVATLPTTGPEIDTQGAPWGFRRKVHFLVAPGREGRGVVLGHYRRGSRRVVPVSECPVHAPEGNAVAAAACQALAVAGVPAANASPGLGGARHVVVRVGGSAGAERVAVIVATHDDERVRRAASALAAAPCATEGVHVNLHPSPGPWLFGGETRHVAGQPRVRETIAGISFLVSPTSFFQTNVDAAGTLVRLVVDAIDAAKAETVADLYAGAGLFALPLAASGCRVVAVEENPRAIEDGRATQELNRIAPDACRFVRARAERFLSRARQSAFSRIATDAVVIDPPREGCPPGFLARVLESWRPRLLAYVSCNPETLARDLASLAARRLVGQGRPYAVSAVQPVDMFPHTEHVEALAIIRTA